MLLPMGRRRVIDVDFSGEMCRVDSRSRYLAKVCMSN